MDENLIKRILPHSQEAEKSVIGSMIIDPEAIAVAAQKLTAEDFYQKAYGLLFSAIVDLDASGKPIDTVTLQNRLREMDAPEELASVETLSGLIDAVPVSTNIGAYAGIVADKAQLRRMIRTMEELTNSCYADKQQAEELMAETEKQVFRILQRSQDRSFTPIADIVMSALNRISSASLAGSTVTGLASGFPDLDFKTDGKTVAIFSLEMSKEQLVNRLLSQESNVDAMKLRNGNLSDSEWDSLVAGADVIGKSNLIIDDTPGISPAELRSKCRRYKLEYNLDIILIDYLQLMSGSGSRRSDSRQQEISEISRSLKEIARELQVPVIALSQLSRAVEQRPDHRPILSDLRESGAIEQDADVVMFLYREDYYNKDTERKGIADVIIAKQRNGPLGDIELAWLPEYTASLERNYQQR